MEDPDPKGEKDPYSKYKYYFKIACVVVTIAVTIGLIISFVSSNSSSGEENTQKKESVGDATQTQGVVKIKVLNNAKDVVFYGEENPLSKKEIYLRTNFVNVNLPPSEKTLDEQTQFDLKVREVVYHTILEKDKIFTNGMKDSSTLINECNTLYFKIYKNPDALEEIKKSMKEEET